MIFVTNVKSAKAAKDYYSQHLAPGDYYSKDSAEMKGIWHGKGAEMLHVSGEVAHDEFLNLCDNINPETDGKRLTPRTKDDRRVLTDFTFDAPKSVTLAYELGGDERIPEVFRKSVRETMADMETAAMSRVRKGGKDTDRLTGNMIWAEHTHRTTRPITTENGQTVDPQLHIHATVFNATFDHEESRWKAIQLGDIVRDKLTYQAAFHARLAANLKDLGYGIEKDGRSFKLAGISKETTAKFSRRTEIIKAEAERLGIIDEKSKSMLGRRTRENKSKDRLSMAEVQKEWDRRLTPEERLAIKTAGSGWAKGDAPITPEQAKEYALEHAFQNSSAVSDKRLQAEALMYGVGSIRPEDVADIAQHPEAIAQPHDGQLFVTTKKVLNNEISFLQFAKDGQRKFQPFIAKWALEKPDNIATRDALAGLSDQQTKAALHILNSRDTVTGARGGAGTGKTRMLQTVNAVITAIETRSGDYSKVHAFAQSTTASRGELRNVGFRDADTLAMLLKSEKIQASLQRQVILIDEAGLLSSKEMREVFDIAKKQEARVILVGDYYQHSSVEAGDAFRLIEKEAGIRYAQLSEIRRQTEPGYKKAVEAIAKGSGKAAQKGFDALNKMGCVIEASGSERHSLLVADYLNAVDDGKSALIIAPTHAEGEKLTDELRRALKERGAVGKDHTFTARRSTGWTDAQKGDVRNYEPGMVIDFHDAVAGTRKRINGKRVTEGGFAKGEAVVVVGRGERGAENGTGAQEDTAGHERAAGIGRPNRDNPAVTGGQRRDNEALVDHESETLVVLRRDGSRAIVPLEQAQRFQVSRTRQLAIARGDRIRITRNGEAKVAGEAKGTKINNGDIFTVDGFTKEGDIRLEKGKLLPKDWGHFSLGYVDTSYASQGKTVDRVFIATGKESLPAANQQQWYVSASRGREQAKIYVDSKKDVREAISRTGQRLSAVELTHTRLAGNWRQRFSQSFERNRVGRFLKQRANAIADRWREREALRYA